MRALQRRILATRIKRSPVGGNKTFSAFPPPHFSLLPNFPENGIFAIDRRKILLAGRTREQQIVILSAVSV